MKPDPDWDFVIASTVIVLLAFVVFAWGWFTLQHYFQH